jgi:N6-adenosine-specific RNA methylase IME4
VADCPWPFGDKLPGKSRGAAKNYETMRIVDLERYLQAQGVAVADDAFLFLWRVSAMQAEALRVMDAWGFVQKTELVWVKTTGPVQSTRPDADDGHSLALMPKLTFGMGRYVRASHETCLIGRRGKIKVSNRSQRSVFFAPVREHSQKPEEFFDIIEKLSPGPYLELFSSGHRRPGWTSLGEAHRETTD